MIPPVSDREIRSCELCIACNSDCDFGYSCNLGLDDLFVNRNEGIRYLCESPLHINVPLSIPIIPCKYHITPDEMKELIDSVAV